MIKTSKELSAVTVINRNIIKSLIDDQTIQFKWQHSALNKSTKFLKMKMTILCAIECLLGSLSSSGYSLKSNPLGGRLIRPGEVRYLLLLPPMLGNTYFCFLEVFFVLSPAFLAVFSKVFLAKPLWKTFKWVHSSRIVSKEANTWGLHFSPCLWQWFQVSRDRSRQSTGMGAVGSWLCAATCGTPQSSQRSPPHQRPPWWAGRCMSAAASPPAPSDRGSTARESRWFASPWSTTWSEMHVRWFAPRLQTQRTIQIQGNFAFTNNLFHFKCTKGLLNWFF